MSATATSPLPEKPALPVLPCPNCSENLLKEGFYNSCTETQTLREDNYTYIVGDHLYVDHDEDNYNTIDHQCDLEAHCRACNTLLPWALYQIRELDGASLAEVPGVIAILMAELQETPPSAQAQI